MKSLLKIKLLARVSRQHNLATRHYTAAFLGYAKRDRFLAHKEKLLVIHHSRKAKALEHRLIPSVHFDEDAKISVQSAWRFMP